MFDVKKCAEESFKFTAKKMGIPTNEDMLLRVVAGSISAAFAAEANSRMSRQEMAPSAEKENGG
jgi:hypothetical protein